MPKCPFSSPHVVTRLDGTKKTILYPCGCCPVCQKNSSFQIFPRINEAIKAHAHCIFFTLTMRDDLMSYAVDPQTGEVLKYDSIMKSKLQSMLKVIDTRLRRKYNFSRKQKPKYEYYFCLEYGPRTNRPHLHGIIAHDYCHSDFDYLRNTWSEEVGYVHRQYVNLGRGPSDRSKVAHYISKYSSKGISPSLFGACRRGVIPKPWRIYSSGLGKTYLNKQLLHWHRADDIKRGDLSPYLYLCRRADTIFSRMVYTDNGYTYPLPKYYQDKVLNRTKIRLEKHDVNGENVPCYKQSEANTLSLLFDLALRRKSLSLYIKSLRDVAANEPDRNIDEIVAISEKSRTFVEKQNYQEVLKSLNTFYLKKLLKHKNISYE